MPGIEVVLESGPTVNVSFPQNLNNSLHHDWTVDKRECRYVDVTQIRETTIREQIKPMMLCLKLMHVNYIG